MSVRGDDPYWPYPEPEPKWLDGELVLWVACPNCGLHALVDDDQAHGRVSTDCPECPFHETVNWWSLLRSGLEDSLTAMGPPSAR